MNFIAGFERNKLPVFLVALACALPIAKSCQAQVSFAGKLVGGTTSFNVNAGNGDTVTIYQFDAGYQPINQAKCDQDIASGNGSIVPVPASGSSTNTQNTTKISDDGPQTIQVSSNLVPGSQLCIMETIAGGTTYYSGIQTVTDPNDFGIVRTFYTAGAVISNQTGSGGSATAAQYIDVGIAFNWHSEQAKDFPVKGDKLNPGINTYVAGRFSSIPVTSAAPANSSSTAGSSSSSASTPSSLNVLSSQESVRVRGGILFPFVVTHKPSGNAFVIAPIAKGGFETLFNPSANAATTSGSSTAVVATTFSPTYDDFSFGFRLAWRGYSADKNSESSPRTKAMIDATMGRFNNLESLTCGTGFSATGATTSPTNTSCFKSIVGPTQTTTYSTYNTNRVAVPRIEVEGFINFPNTPLVLGIDANLAQYQVYLPSAKLDLLNKAGSDVRIYFGLTGNLTDLFKGVKSTGSSGN